jgi:hypothetical protein
MRSAVTLTLYLIIAAGAVATPRAFQSEESHDRWLKERYAEATSVKVGMTRADLKKVFDQDGGLQPATRPRYVLKSSDIIKVDVEFAIPEGMNHRNAPDDLVHIKDISKPYLEEHYLD